MAATKRRLAGQSLWKLILVSACVLVGLVATGSSELVGAQLKPDTVKAFNRYVAIAEARMKRKESRPDDLLYIETLPKDQFQSAMATLKQGQVYVQRISTRDANGEFDQYSGRHGAPLGGRRFHSGRTTSSVLQVLRDYKNFKNIYKPEVIRSRLVKREDPDNYKVYLRLQKQSIVTVTLDTWYHIHFNPLGANSGYSRSVSTRIQQVEDAGTPQEHLDPVGQGSGYLWRIISYWRYQQHDNGVIIEWESIALSRNVPFLLAWFVKPLIRSIASEAVHDMLSATRKAVLSEKNPTRQALAVPPHGWFAERSAQPTSMPKSLK